MKKLLLVLLFVPLVSFGQSSSSINEQLTQDLLSIYAQNHIVGFSVAIVTKIKYYTQKGLVILINLKTKLIQKTPFKTLLQSLKPL